MLQEVNTLLCSPLVCSVRRVLRRAQRSVRTFLDFSAKVMLKWLGLIVFALPTSLEHRHLPDRAIAIVAQDIDAAIRAPDFVVMMILGGPMIEEFDDLNLSPPQLELGGPLVIF